MGRNRVVMNHSTVADSFQEPTVFLGMMGMQVPQAQRGVQAGDAAFCTSPWKIKGDAAVCTHQQYRDFAIYSTHPQNDRDAHCQNGERRSD